MPAIPVVEALRGLPPIIEARNLQISAQNIQIMNRLMEAELTASIATAGLGSVVDVSA